MEWRILPSCEFYEVSDDGQVRSIDRVLTLRGKGGELYERTKKGTLLKPLRHTNGYLMVNAPNRRTIHALVLEAFIGERPKGYDINHKDGDKTNNRLVNLEYCSRGENMRHAVATGLCPKPPVKRGIEQHKAVLDEIQVREIRAKYANGKGVAAMAREYGVGESTIRNVAQRKTWAWLDD